MVKDDKGRLGASTKLARAAKKDSKPLPYPKKWENLARTNPDLYSRAVWKSLSKSEQAEKIAQLRPTQHRLLHLCNSSFPLQFTEAWETLSYVGTSTYLYANCLSLLIPNNESFPIILLSHLLPIHEEMKRHNDEMEARFEGKGCRPLPDSWINSELSRTELSWWELDDLSQMNFIVERVRAVEKAKGAEPRNHDDDLPEGFWFFVNEISLEVLESLSDAGTFISLLPSIRIIYLFPLLLPLLLLLLLLLLLHYDYLYYYYVLFYHQTG